MKRLSFQQNSIAGKLYGLILNIFVPMVLLAATILVMFIHYNVRYSSVTGNITTASRFNQNFKSDVDLKMYYYRGLKEWDNEKGYLRDTCLTAQDRYKQYLDYFEIKY